MSYGSKSEILIQRVTQHLILPLGTEYHPPESLLTRDRISPVTCKRPLTDIASSRIEVSTQE